MNPLPAVILGVPFHNVSIDDAIEYVFDLMDHSSIDRKSRIVCVADINCIVDALYGEFKKTHHSEFLSILRRADMVIGEYPPAVRISGFLGPPLKECILSGDLISRIAREAVMRRKSVYILGNGAESVKNSSVMLEESFPDLRVAGWNTLLVPPEDRNLVDAHEEDAFIVDKINASSADILFISLGSPRQELWFDRNRERLQVPVCICVGDIFSSLAVSELCAPAWTRSACMDKLFHSNRKQGHMRKCSLINLFKFWLLILPSILLHQYAKIVLRKIPLKKSRGTISCRYWTRGGKDILSLTLPGVIDSRTAQRLSTLVPKRPDSHLILDYSSVAFIDSAGLGILLYLVLLWDTDKYEVLHVGLNQCMKKILSCNGVFTSIPSRQFSSHDEVLAYLDARIEEQTV